MPLHPCLVGDPRLCPRACGRPKAERARLLMQEICVLWYYLEDGGRFKIGFVRIRGGLASAQLNWVNRDLHQRVDDVVGCELE